MIDKISPENADEYVQNLVAEIVQNGIKEYLKCDDIYYYYTRVKFIEVMKNGEIEIEEQDEEDIWLGNIHIIDFIKNLMVDSENGYFCEPHATKVNNLNDVIDTNGRDEEKYVNEYLLMTGREPWDIKWETANGEEASDLLVLSDEGERIFKIVISDEDRRSLDEYNTYCKTIDNQYDLGDISKGKKMECGPTLWMWLWDSIMKSGEDDIDE